MSNTSVDLKSVSESKESILIQVRSMEPFNNLKSITAAVVVGQHDEGEVVPQLDLELQQFVNLNALPPHLREVVRAEAGLPEAQSKDADDE